MRNNVIDKTFYCCTKYRKFGKEGCSSHNIEARTVHEVVLADIQKHAGQALADRKAMVTDIAERLNLQLSADKEQHKKELRQCKQRVSEIENLYAKRYEDMTRELITEKRFQMLSSRYDSEQEELSAKIKELEKSAIADKEQLSSIEQFAEQISGYAGITELNFKIINQLIEKILVSEPVETLVLYFGYDRHWKTPRTLFECLDLPEEIKPYVNDYRMNLYEVAYLSDEQVELFTSDFKVVADYFVQMRKNRNYVASEVTIKHVHELLQLMAVMTQGNRFEDVYSLDMERRTMTMCEVLDRVENRGIQKGVIQGEDTILSLMNYLLSNNRTEDAIKATEDKAYRNKLLAEIFGEK